MPITIQQAIDTIIAAVPGAPLPDTVDTVNIGDPPQPLAGIATTFLATCSEYVRDATRLGQGKALIVLGHAASEEPGMRWVMPWLRARLPGGAIRFVPTGRLFHWL